MARPLVLSWDGVEYPVSIVKIDREKLYGKVEIEAFDEKGREAELRVLAADGKTLIDKGGTALATVTDKGDSVDRSELVPVDEDDKTIETVPSSFNVANKLKDGTVEEYFQTIVKSVYLVQPFDGTDLDPLRDALSDDERLLTFPFSWRGGLEYDAAWLAATDGELFMITGRQVEFPFIKLNQAAVLESTEEEEISAEDIEFDLL
jgi:hypothetical protein